MKSLLHRLTLPAAMLLFASARIAFAETDAATNRSAPEQTSAANPDLDEQRLRVGQRVFIADSGRPPLRLLNVDFAPANTSAIGPAAIGKAVTDYWNTYRHPWQSQWTEEKLRWSDQRTSRVSLTVENAPGQWGNGSSNVMFDGYIYPHDNRPIILTVKSLPPGVYDFYLYGHGATDPQADNPDCQNSAFNVSTRDRDYGVKRTTTSPGWRAADFEEGQQYVVFRGVVVRDEPVTITASPDAFPQAFINGLQIAQVFAWPDATNTASAQTNTFVTAEAAGSPGRPRRLLNVDFAASPRPEVPPTGPAAIGMATNDVWNMMTHPWLANYSEGNLRWADGSVSDVSILIENAPGCWGNGVSDCMYASYSYPHNGGNVVVTVTNLPTGIYDLYLYGHGAIDPSAANPDGQNGAFHITTPNADYGLKATTTNAGWNSTSWEEGVQYVVFRGVAISNEPLTVTVCPEGSPYAIIAGLQIAQMRDSRDQAGPVGNGSARPPLKAILDPKRTVELLANGIVEEDGNLDLEAASRAYRAAIERFDRQRPSAANAVFRLAECYRKLDRTNEARALYLRIVREFPDQTALVEPSRKNLSEGSGGVGSGGDNGQTFGISATDSTNNLSRIEMLRAALEAQARGVQDLLKQFRPSDTGTNDTEELPRLYNMLVSLEREMSLNDAARFDLLRRLNSTRQAKRHAILDHLRQINQARELFALEKRKTANDTVTADDLAPYLPDGMPKPVLGETYIFSPLSRKPAAQLPSQRAAI